MRYFLGACVALFFLSKNVVAELDITLGDPEQHGVVESFLQSQQNQHEGAQSKGYVVSDINHDGFPEIILVWAKLGPTYWKNTLTIFRKKDKEYEVYSVMPLIGEATLSSVKDNIIHVDQVVYAESDPNCCPTIKKQMRYVLREDVISQVD